MGSMVTYTDQLGEVTADVCMAFEGWPNPPSPEKHLELLQKSDEIVLAKEGSRVVGFITAHADGVLSAYLPLIEVLPEYRSQGIGKELLRLMLMKLKDYYMIDLTCDPALREFYLSLGMSAKTAMSLRNYDIRTENKSKPPLERIQERLIERNAASSLRVVFASLCGQTSTPAPRIAMVVSSGTASTRSPTDDVRELGCVIGGGLPSSPGAAVGSIRPRPRLSFQWEACRPSPKT
ncbi:MAG: GNAT family N-acetyltransferase [Fimbriimonadaceae bacterium]